MRQRQQSSDTDASVQKQNMYVTQIHTYVFWNRILRSDTNESTCFEHMRHRASLVFKRWLLGTLDENLNTSACIGYLL